jgi:hypothetical protein
MKLIHNDDGAAHHFWGEVAPTQHLVQIYDSEAPFLVALESFLVEGLSAGDGVVVIATAAHRDALESRLHARGVDATQLRESDRYIDLDANETLGLFMVDDWPDETRFRQTIAAILERASAGHKRRVRAFGEMVALMWAQGQCAATVRLEHLWHRICEAERLALLCAYPKSGFTSDVAASIRQICDAHSHVVVAGNRLIPRSVNSMNELTRSLAPNS